MIRRARRPPDSRHASLWSLHPNRIAQRGGGLYDEPLFIPRAYRPAAAVAWLSPVCENRPMGREGDKQRLIEAAAAVATRYVAAERIHRVAPDESALDELAQLADLDLHHPTQPEAILDLLESLEVATVKSTGGRYFGFVNGGVKAIGLATSLLTAAWDQNVALPVMSPAASAIDQQATSWIIELLGLPSTATAAFCAGATVANITAIVSARDSLLLGQGWDVQAQGLGGAPPLQIVASEEIHVSVLKALRIAGLGNDTVQFVPTDRAGRIRPDRMPALAEPALVLLQSGNVNTGHSDPFREIIRQLDRARTWVHVDGAFGLWASASPRLAHLNDGVELADSWATDAHKWLNAPYDSGIVVVSDGSALRRSMRMDASYVPTTDERPLMNMGLQMSQAARAISTWAILATEGREGIAAMVERSCDHALLLADLLAAAGATVQAPVVLNQALVSFGDDTVTDAVIAEVQRRGTCWLGGTTWQGRRAMRVSVSDTSTTVEDIQRCAESVIEAWGRVRGSR